MAKIIGLDGHLIEEFSKYQWFTRPILGTERLFGHNLHPYFSSLPEMRILGRLAIHCGSRNVTLKLPLLAFGSCPSWTFRC